jgi:hypothetical protein
MTAGLCVIMADLAAKTAVFAPILTLRPVAS